MKVLEYETGSFAEMWTDPETITHSEREKQISYTNIYVESRKTVQMNIFAKHKQRHRCRE